MGEYIPTKEEHIKRLRINLMIHGYIYYVLDDSIISDVLYDSMSKKLAEINENIGFYDEVFQDWDGSTGYHLLYDGYIIDKANYIYERFKNVRTFTS